MADQTSDSSSDAVSDRPVVKTLSLVKGEHTYAFRYTVGEESVLIDALADLARSREQSFDWFDAAVLSHQLGQHLSKELQSFWPKEK